MTEHARTTDHTSVKKRALVRTMRHVAPIAGIVVAFCCCYARLVYLAQDLRNAALADLAAHRLTAVAFMGAQVTLLLSMMSGLLALVAIPVGVAAWRSFKRIYRQALANEREAGSNG